MAVVESKGLMVEGKRHLGQNCRGGGRKLSFSGLVFSPVSTSHHPIPFLTIPEHCVVAVAASKRTNG